MATTQTAPVALPRVAITYCTQCRWMLRAAYFGQELLSTFGMQIGEIALIPTTGGLFTVELTYLPSAEEGKTAEVTKVLLWDRKAEGGFPETKVLKQKVRDCIDPSRDLGHSDKHGKKKDHNAVESNKATEEQKTVEESKGTEKETTGRDNEAKKEEEIVQEKTIENAVEKEKAVKGGEQEENNGVELKRNPDGTICEDCR